MYVTILAGNVGPDDAVTEDVGCCRRVVVLLTGDDGKVAVGASCADVVGCHLLGGEVYHHRTCAVHDEVDAVAVVPIPILVVLW